jgi:CRISPR-associated endonuclease Cas1
VPTRTGVLVVDGYGVRVRVGRGRLAIADGIGRHRREGQFARAGSGLRRLVVLGHTGFVTLDALRWLADTGVGYVALDSDGRLLAATGNLGRDDPRLRRAQAQALDTQVGDDIARRLIAEKIAGQAETLTAVDRVAPVAEATVAAMRDAAGRLHLATCRDEVRQAEALAAAAYWSAWADVPVRFARRDAGRVPEAWLTVGTRSSPLTSSPRLAVNPANAVLNYLYVVLEAEARLACLAVGLDPGLGVLHGDLKARDSLALDVVEPVRPVVDRFALRVITDRAFRAADFVETRQGVCRVLEPLSHELAATMLDWRVLVGSIAERVATLLFAGRQDTSERQPTPLTGTNRAAGRRSSREGSRRLAGPPQSARRACAQCGEAVGVGRRVCDACLAEVVGDQRAAFVSAGQAHLRRQREAGSDRSHGGDAGRLRAGKVSASRRAAAEWDLSTGSRPDRDVFPREVMPRLAGLSASLVAELTGLSRPYCAAILRGERVPHPRWWSVLEMLAVGGNGSAVDPVTVQQRDGSLLRGNAKMTATADVASSTPRRYSTTRTRGLVSEQAPAVASTSRFSLIDLFSGCGGFSCGAGLLGDNDHQVDVLAGVDWDRAALAAFKRNHPAARAFRADLAVLDDVQIRDISRRLGLIAGRLDLLHASPPCQPFSANTRSADSTNGDAHLFRAVTRWARVLRPRAVTVENVIGMRTASGGALHSELVEGLEALGYAVTFGGINAVAYGVPQNRIRLLYVAYRADAALPPRLPPPTHARHGELLLPAVTVQDAIGDLPPREAGDSSVPWDGYTTGPVSSLQGLWFRTLMRGAQLDVAEVTGHRAAPVSDLARRRIQALKPGEAIAHLPAELQPRMGYRGAYGRLDPEKPAPTITANCDNPSRGRFSHYSQLRGITTREAARLQSFPDHFSWPSPFRSLVTTQIGNAVPPLLATAVLRTVAEDLTPEMENAVNHPRDLVRVR